MAINPGVDLLSEALLAADPQRAKAAEERLARIAVQDVSAGVPFDSLLASPASPDQAFSLSSAAPIRMTSSGLLSVKSGKPYQQFEVTVLKTFLETMLPAKANAVFGSGFAGGVWKSWLAQSLAEVVGQAGGIGIASALEARSKKAKPDA
jgi:peptidoglycan hydrolase FlgJ